MGKDKSTQSKREYLFDHILYGAMLAYNIIAEGDAILCMDQEQ